jgi:hypothetical protein
MADIDSIHCTRAADEVMDKAYLLIGQMQQANKIERKSHVLLPLTSSDVAYEVLKRHLLCVEALPAPLLAKIQS